MRLQVPGSWSAKVLPPLRWANSAATSADAIASTMNASSRGPVVASEPRPLLGSPSFSPRYACGAVIGDRSTATADGALDVAHLGALRQRPLRQPHRPAAAECAEPLLQRADLGLGQVRGQLKQVTVELGEADVALAGADRDV